MFAIFPKTVHFIEKEMECFFVFFDIFQLFHWQEAAGEGRSHDEENSYTQETTWKGNLSRRPGGKNGGCP